jgi:hypothetical protein
MTSPEYALRFIPTTFVPLSQRERTGGKTERNDVFARSGYAADHSMCADAGVLVHPAQCANEHMVADNAVPSQPAQLAITTSLPT